MKNSVSFSSNNDSSTSMVNESVDPDDMVRVSDPSLTNDDDVVQSKNVNLTNIVDKQIVGGFVLRVGDLQYNASFKDQLKKLEQEFLNITIQ